MENNNYQGDSLLQETTDVVSFKRLLKKPEILNILNLLVFHDIEDKILLGKLYGLFNLSLTYTVTEKEDEFNRQQL